MAQAIEAARQMRKRFPRFVIQGESLRDETQLCALFDPLVLEFFSLQKNRAAVGWPNSGDERHEVVLPAPFGPSSPKNSPGSSVSEMSSSARSEP